LRKDDALRWDRCEASTEHRMLLKGPGVPAAAQLVESEIFRWLVMRIMRRFAAAVVESSLRS
jgi:hypothetical protein